MESKQQQIANQTLKLIVNQGIEHTSLQDILDAANISKGTFYKYFSSKDECIAQIIKQTYGKIREELDQLLIDQLRSNQAIFKEQLILYLTRTYSYYLNELIRTIRQGQSTDLRKMVFQEEKRDIQWMAERLVEVKGEVIRPYSKEVMSFFYGMLQTVIVISKSSQKSIIPQKVIHLIYRYVELILAEMMETKQAIFSIEMDEEMQQRESLVEELKKLQGGVVGRDKVLIEGLLEELNRKEIRYPIVESLCSSLSPALSGISEQIKKTLKER